MSEPIQVRNKRGETVTVTGYGPRFSDRPHDFESERDAPEGGLGPCAVCGLSRGNAIHG